MIRTRHFLATLVVAASPLLAHAQTANTPGGQAATGTPLDQTATTPQKNVPATTKTSPSTTNPAGSTPGTASPSNAAAGTTVTTGSTATPKTKRGTKNNTPTGDVPTYPAPAPDGTPTK